MGDHPDYYIAYVGCYTRPNQADPFFCNDDDDDDDYSSGVPHDRTKVGTGIVALRVARDTGRLEYCYNDNDINGDRATATASTTVALTTDIPNPSYLTVIDGVKKEEGGPHVLCVVSEVEEGQIHAFTIDPSNPARKLVPYGGDNNSLSTGGSFPCHVSAFRTTPTTRNGSSEETTTMVLVANYGMNEGGVVSQFALASSSSEHNDDNNDGREEKHQRQLVAVTTVSHGPGSHGHAERQTASHAHCCVHIPPASQKNNDNDDDDTILCSDLGADALIRYRLVVDDNNNDDSTKVDQMRIVPAGRLQMPIGSGPRSIALRPTSFSNHKNDESDEEEEDDDLLAIVSLELTAEIQLVVRRLPECDDDSCGWERVGDPVSILPNDEWPGDDDSDNNNIMQRFNHGRWGSDAVWSRDGRYIYAAARLYNHIAVFRLTSSSSLSSMTEKAAAAVDGSGAGSALPSPTPPPPTPPYHHHDYQLELVQRIPTGGRTPRCLTVSPCGQFLLVAHQHSHDVSSFRIIDEPSGHLQYVDRIEVPLASCVTIMETTTMTTKPPPL